MADIETRRIEAERALQSLEITVEQYHFHLEGVAHQPHEAEKARELLAIVTRELELQRKYCKLLRKATPADKVRAKNGLRAA